MDDGQMQCVNGFECCADVLIVAAAGGPLRNCVGICIVGDLFGVGKEGAGGSRVLAVGLGQVVATMFVCHENPNCATSML